MTGCDHNPNFKVVEFDHFKMYAGFPNFVMSVRVHKTVLYAYMETAEENSNKDNFARLTYRFYLEI